jgi:predicted MFS family arabinose efflux permease
MCEAGIVSVFVRLGLTPFTEQEVITTSNLIFWSILGLEGAAQIGRIVKYAHYGDAQQDAMSTVVVAHNIAKYQCDGL